MWQTAFPLWLKHLAGPLIQDHQAHFSLSTSGVSEGRESHVDFPNWKPWRAALWLQKELTFSAAAKVWLSRTAGTINFTASPSIYPWKIEKFCRERARENSLGWEGCWVLQFCTLAHHIWEKCQTVLGQRKYRCKPLLCKKAPMVPECSRQLQCPKCNSGQSVEYPVDIGSELHSPSISSSSAMTLISVQQLTRTDLVTANGSLW